MIEIQNLFNIEKIVSSSSINCANNIESLIDQLNDMKSKIRINVKDSASSLRLSFERYLGIRYHDGIATETTDINNKPKTSADIIKEQRKKGDLKNNDIDYNAFQCLRLFANAHEHIELFDKYKDEISRNTVFKIFVLFLAIISKDYSKYFINIDDVIKKHNYDRLDFVFGQFDENNNKSYKWLFDFIKKITLNEEVNRYIYDLPIKNYEIVRKLPAGDVALSNHIVFEKYDYIVKQGESSYYYVVPNIQTIKQGKRNNNVDNIVSNKDNTYDLMAKSHTIEFERNKGELVKAYDFYKIKKNAMRLDEYMLIHKGQINKTDALSILKSIVDILKKYQRKLNLRVLDEKSFFITEIENGIKINVCSFGYAKIKDEWEKESNSPTVLDLIPADSYFSAVSVMPNLSLDIDDSNYSEKMDVYSLIVLLAYIMDADTGVNKPITSNCFSSFSENNSFKNAVLESIKADYFDEIMSLEDFGDFIDEEIRINANS